MKHNQVNKAGKPQGFWVIGHGGKVIRGHYDNGARVGLWDWIDKKSELVHRGTYGPSGSNGLWKIYKADCYNTFFKYTNHHNQLSSGPKEKSWTLLSETIFFR